MIGFEPSSDKKSDRPLNAGSLLNVQSQVGFLSEAGPLPLGKPRSMEFDTVSMNIHHYPNLNQIYN